MRKLLARVGASATVLATPAISLAQFNDASVNSLRDLLSPVQIEAQPSLVGLVVTVLNFLIFVAAIIAIFYLIWAGIKYITASTVKEEAEKARQAIYNAIIGIVVIVLSYMIVQYVSSVAKQTIEGGEFGPTNTGGLGVPRSRF